MDKMVLQVCEACHIVRSLLHISNTVTVRTVYFSYFHSIMKCRGHELLEHYLMAGQAYHGYENTHFLFRWKERGKHEYGVVAFVVKKEVTSNVLYSMKDMIIRD